MWAWSQLVDGEWLTSEAIDSPFDLQITPFLGMLRELQCLHERRMIAEQKELSEDGMTSGVPATVHLIWVVRDRDELQLLDSQLLAAAA